MKRTLNRINKGRCIAGPAAFNSSPPGVSNEILMKYFKVIAFLHELVEPIIGLFRYPSLGNQLIFQEI